jgi:hypothetical protein
VIPVKGKGDTAFNRGVQLTAFDWIYGSIQTLGKTADLMAMLAQSNLSDPFKGQTTVESGAFDAPVSAAMDREDDTPLMGQPLYTIESKTIQCCSVIPAMGLSYQHAVAGAVLGGALLGTAIAGIATTSAAADAGFKVGYIFIGAAAGLLFGAEEKWTTVHFFPAYLEERIGHRFWGRLLWDNETTSPLPKFKLAGYQSRGGRFCCCFPEVSFIDFKVMSSDGTLVTKEYQSRDGQNTDFLYQYVHGNVNGEMGKRLHATNHLMQAGIIPKISMKLDITTAGGPSVLV